MITVKMDDPTDIISDYNRILEFLKAQSADKIPLTTHKPLITADDVAATFNLLRNFYLKRLLDLCNSFDELVNKNQMTAAIIIGRAIMETISNFYYIIKNSNTYLDKQEYKKLFELICSYMLGGNKAGCHHENNLELNSIHVNKGIGELALENPLFEKRYHSMCEFIHPNSAGLMLAYSRMDKENSYIHLLNKVPLEEVDVYITSVMTDVLTFNALWNQSNELVNNIIGKWVLDPSIGLKFKQAP